MRAAGERVPDSWAGGSGEQDGGCWRGGSGQFGGRRCRCPPASAVSCISHAGHLACEGGAGDDLDAGPCGQLLGGRSQPTGRDDHPQAVRVLMGQGAVQFPRVADGDRLGRRVPLALDGEIAVAGIGRQDVGAAVAAPL